MLTDALKLVKELRVDRLDAKIKTVIDVCDADDYIIASIDMTERYIEFNHGFYTRGCQIPCIKKLLDDGYDSNTTPRTAKIEPTREIKLIPESESSDIADMVIRTADQIRSDIIARNRFEIGAGLHDCDDFVTDYKTSHLVMDAFLGKYDNAGVVIYKVVDDYTKQTWLMSRAEWDKL